MVHISTHKCMSLDSQLGVRVPWQESAKEWPNFVSVGPKTVLPLEGSICYVRAERLPERALWTLNGSDGMHTFVL